MMKNKIKIAIVFFAYVFCIVLAYYVSGQYSEGILYAGEKPYCWGKTASVLVPSIILHFSQALIIGCGITVIVLVRNIKNETITCRKEFAVCGIMNLAALLYIVYASRKYDPVIYQVDEPLLNSSGEQVTIIQAMSIPIVAVILLTLLVIICIVFEMNATNISDYKAS